MTPRRPTVLVFALLAGWAALGTSVAGAMGHGAMADGGAAEAPRVCCSGEADSTPCPPDGDRSLAEAALCCAAGHDAPHEVAVVPPAPVRLDVPVALAAAWLVRPPAPPAPRLPGDATLDGPPRPAVRSHLAVSVLLI